MTLLQKNWPAYLLIILFGAVAYANTFNVPFYFDGVPCIVENPVVHDLTNLSRLDTYGVLGISEDIRNNIVTRLVTYLTFAANYRLHGLTVTGYHLVNLILHLANALLVYRLVCFVRPSVTARTSGCDPLPLIVALLFVVHPLQTTAVTYIVQRFAVLATFFSLAALCSYVLSVRASVPRWRKVWYVCALAATILAMYSKEIAFPLPILMALFDVVFLSGTQRQRLRRLAPFLATLLLLPLTVMVLANISDVTGQSASNVLDLVNIGGGSRWSYFLTQWPVIVTYLRLLAFPAGLHLEYDFPRFTTVWDPVIIASGVLLAALLYLGVRLLSMRSSACDNAQNRRLIGFGIVWFFTTLAMESSIIPLDDLIFEYRLYLPSLGFFLAVTAAVDLLRRRMALTFPAVNTVAIAGAFLLLMVLTTATVMRNRTWQDELVFWRDNVSKSPNRARPHCSLAEVYRKRGEIAKAVAELKIAGNLNPYYWVPFESLGDIRWNLGLYAQAAVDYEEAQRRGNNSRQLLLKLGRSQRWSGQPEAAWATFSTLLAANSDDPDALSEMRALQR